MHFLYGIRQRIHELTWLSDHFVIKVVRLVTSLIFFLVTSAPLPKGLFLQLTFLLLVVTSVKRVVVSIVTSAYIGDSHQ
jgi:hypothetical protein